MDEQAAVYYIILKKKKAYYNFVFRAQKLFDYVYQSHNERGFNKPQVSI